MAVEHLPVVKSYREAFAQALMIVLLLDWIGTRYL